MGTEVVNSPARPARASLLKTSSTHPTQKILLYTEEQQLYNDWHPHPIVKGEPRQPLEEAHFCLYPWSFSSHYSHLVAMGEWRNLHTRLPLRLNRPVHIHCALLIHLLSTTHKQGPEVLELLHSRQIRAVSAPFSCWQRCFCGTNSHPSHITLSCQSPHLMLEVN